MGCGNIAIGLIMGIALKQIKTIKNKGLQVVLTAITAIIGTFVGVELIKSLIDSWIVGQLFEVRFIKNLSSFIADAFVIVISLPVCALLEKPAKMMRYGE